MTKKILLTRSFEDNQKLRKILAPKGYDCINFPLLDSVDLFTDLVISPQYTDIIITSKRAAALLAHANNDKNVWVVGQASASILHRKNYTVKYVASSAMELKEHLPVAIYSKAIYLASNFIAVKMPPEIKMLEVYLVSYKTTISDHEIKMLKNGLEYILLYSENCAKTLVKLIVDNDLLKYLENATIIAISSKVEMAVKSYFNRAVGCTSASKILEILEEYDRKS